MSATPLGVSKYYQGALTGNLVTIELAGYVIGLVQALQAQEDFGLQPVSGLGQVTPVEHAPSIARFNLSCETIYISTGAALSAAGQGQVQAWDKQEEPSGLWGPKIGGTTTGTMEGIGIIPATAVDILRGAVFNIAVYRIADLAGSANTTPVRTYIDCSYAGGSISFQKHQIIIQNATFMALDYSGKYYQQ